MRISLFIINLLLLQINFAYAHVGSPDVSLESMAGPYHILVNINPPGAIPGTATITLFVDNGSGVKVYARPIYFSYGKNGSPAADPIEAVPGQPGRFEGIIWLMDNGSASIELSVSGPLGKGEILIPIVAISTIEKKVPASTAYTLLSLGVFLFVLLITIIGLSVSEGITRSGEPVPANRKRARRIAFAITAILSSLIVYGGNLWWQNKAKNYKRYLFKPMHASYNLEKKNGVNELHLTIDTANSQRSQMLPYVIPDHGKIMHLFVIRFPGMDVFAHLHPVRDGLLNFVTDLPALPPGRYLTYADIVYSNGFTETMKDTLEIKDSEENIANADTAFSDPDDSRALAPVFKVNNESARENKNLPGNKVGENIVMNDGTQVVLEDSKKTANYLAGQLYLLRFSFWDKNNKPIKPGLYMGMSGHAVIIRDDGNVFAHIHPVGTYSMAAQNSLLGRISLSDEQYHLPDQTLFRDSIDRLVNTLKNASEEERNNYLMKSMNMPASMMAPGKMDMNMPGMAGDTTMMMNEDDNTVSFPYTFPSAGKYRVWVQVKINGQILTAAFDRNVK